MQSIDESQRLPVITGHEQDLAVRHCPDGPDEAPGHAGLAEAVHDDMTLTLIDELADQIGRIDGQIGWVTRHQRLPPFSGSRLEGQDWPWSAVLVVPSWIPQIGLEIPRSGADPEVGRWLISRHRR